MEKILGITLLLALFLPASFSLECEGINPKDIGTSSISYLVSGFIDLNFEDYTFENLVFNFRGLPGVIVIKNATDMAISLDANNNSILVYEKENVTEDISWYFNASLAPTSSNVKVSKNSKYPYAGEFPDDVKKYLEFTRTANEDLNIKILTSNLLTGVNDYLTAVETVAKFAAYYVEYDLNYFNSTSETASTIYNVRRGVCDEFSTFAISMFRSAGIPARYVSGYSYTNVGDKECFNFESHSWIEVYIPEHGWVSMDFTYKEFFWLNAAHLPLYRNDDLLDISSFYIERRGSGESEYLNSNDYNFLIELTGYNKINSNLIINVSAPAVVAQNSYLLVNVSIKNPTDYWVMDTLISTPILTIDLINDKHAIPIVIPPMQSITKYFIFRIPDLECPTSCYSDANFKFSVGGGKFESKIVRINSDYTVNNSLEELTRLIPVNEQILSADLLVTEIKFNKERFLSQDPIISFLIRNVGSSKIDVDFTIEYLGVNSTDTIQDLLINEERLFEKSLTLPETKGVIPVNLIFNFNDESLNYNSSFIVLQTPPYEINLVDIGNYQYSINLETAGPVTGNIQLSVNGKRMLDQDIQVNNFVDIGRKNLKEGDNVIELVLDYSEGDNYYFKVMNTNYKYSLSFFQRIQLIIDSIVNFFKIIFR